MTNPQQPRRNPNNLSSERYARLRAEAKAPYRGLRLFIYFACGASGLIGGMIFLAQLAAGRNLETTLPNLAVQVAVVAIALFLYRLEQKASRR